MSGNTYTYGEIRKKVEVKMHKELGVNITQAQVVEIRKLAPLVAEGKIKYNAAIAKVKLLGGYEGK